VTKTEPHRPSINSRKTLSFSCLRAENPVMLGAEAWST